MTANSAEQNKQVKIIVGSSESCDIVIRDIKVSKNHCELLWVDGAWHVRDLDSTNGTFVDGRKISQLTRISPESSVTLGRNVTLEIPPKPISENKRGEITNSNVLPTQTVASKPNLKPIVFGLSAGALVALVLSMLFWFKPSSGTLTDNSTQDTQSKAAESQATPGSTTSAVPTNNSLTATNTASTTDAPKPSPYWAILAVNGNDQSKRLIGNAVAVGPHRLVTLASITEALEELKDQYPKLVLAQHSLMKPISPRGISYHPKYQPALESLKKFEKELNARLEKVGNQAEPSLEESLDWSNKLDAIMEEIASVELATLECDETLPNFISISSTSPSSQATLTLEGYPMILPTPPIEQNLKTFLIAGNAKLLEDRGRGDGKFMVETSDFSGFPFLSLACTNDSKLLGLVVRQPQVEGIGAKQVGKLVRVEEFWK